MDLLEYQTKELFRQMGIPVLPSQRIAQPTDIKELKIPYPIVLKPQVYGGTRSRTSGTRFAENTIDAIASAQAMFRLPIKGKHPNLLLAEPKYEADWEFHLAVVLDSAARRPLLLGSVYGGYATSAVLESMHQVIVDQDFSPYYARRLVLKMGLKGILIQSVSVILEKMYALFVQHDLDRVEINPLAVSRAGELMALDGKVTINRAALGRHESLANMVSGIQASSQICSPLKPTCVSLQVVAEGAMEGAIGLLSNGRGLTLATLELLKKSQGNPASYVDLGEEHRYCSPPIALKEYLEQGLELILQNKMIKVVLVNLLCGSVSCLQVAEILAEYLQRHSSSKFPELVIRLAGREFHQAQAVLLPLGIPVIEHLDAAIAQTVKLTQTQPSWNFNLQNRFRTQPPEQLPGSLSGSQPLSRP
jgi:succinyl-CoA synthetase beta subunit